MIPQTTNRLKEVMYLAGKCENCGKVSSFGNNVSHSKRRTSRRWLPNVQKTRVLVGGELRTVHYCTRCLRTLAKKSA